MKEVVSSGLRSGLCQTRGLTTCFRGKEEVLRQIHDFINGKEMYRKIGKPYHLGIVLYGEPGCGKTSFINALANELGRSIKEINFSKLKTADDLEKHYMH